MPKQIFCNAPERKMSQFCDSKYFTLYLCLYCKVWLEIQCPYKLKMNKYWSYLSCVIILVKLENTLSTSIFEIGITKHISISCSIFWIWSFSFSTNIHCQHFSLEVFVMKVVIYSYIVVSSVAEYKKRSIGLSTPAKN